MGAVRDKAFGEGKAASKAAHDSEKEKWSIEKQKLEVKVTGLDGQVAKLNTEVKELKKRKPAAHPGHAIYTSTQHNATSQCDNVMQANQWVVCNLNFPHHDC